MSAKWKVNGGRHREKTRDFSTLLKPRHHFVQIDVREFVAVIGQKHFFTSDLLPDSP